MFRSLLLALTLTAPLAVAACSEAGSSEISVEDAFARETIGVGTVGAAYMTITNTGGADDRLINAVTPAAGTTELHTHEKDGEIMRMRKVDAIAVPAGATAELKPGGDHVMLFELAEPLKPGAMFPVTLTFENAGDIEIEVSVIATGDSHGGMDHSGMDHGDMDHGDMDHGSMDHGDMDHSGH